MVSPDAIVFITRGPKEIRFEHTERTAVVMRSRLRTDLMLGTGEAEVRIRIPAAARRKLRRALKESGIKVVERPPDVRGSTVASLRRRAVSEAGRISDDQCR